MIRGLQKVRIIFVKCSRKRIFTVGKRMEQSLVTNSFSNPLIASVESKCQNLKYQSCTPSACKDIEIQISECLASISYEHD